MYCLVCHGEDGRGAPFTTVALQDAARGMEDATPVRFIAQGVTGTSMPGFDKTLTEDQIEDLIAFIRTW